MYQKIVAAFDRSPDSGFWPFSCFMNAITMGRSWIVPTLLLQLGTAFFPTYCNTENVTHAKVYQCKFYVYRPTLYQTNYLINFIHYRKFPSELIDAWSLEEKEEVFMSERQ